MGNSLARAGVPVQQIATIGAASLLPFSFEFLWAPIVDGCWTRKSWFTLGAAAMCLCLLALLLAPWDSAAVPLMTLLAFLCCAGAAIAAVAIKGLMAYEVSADGLPKATAYYTAGGAVAKSIAGAGTLWLLAHLAARPLVAVLNTGAAALAATAILMASPGESGAMRELPAKLVAALADLWGFLRTRNGMMIAVLCVVPFGAAGEAGLVGAIAREWAVGPNLLAAYGAVGVVASIAGAMAAGWIAMRVGPWKTYLLLGWIMIAVMPVLALSPRTPPFFLAVEFLYRAAAGGCYAALLGIILAGIGKGAASTKAAAMWSLAVFASAYPELIEGAVHDQVSTQAMLLSDAGLGIAGFSVLFIVSRCLGFSLTRVDTPATAGAAQRHNTSTT